MSTLRQHRCTILIQSRKRFIIRFLYPAYKLVKRSFHFSYIASEIANCNSFVFILFNLGLNRYGFQSLKSISRLMKVIIVVASKNFKVSSRQS